MSESGRFWLAFFLSALGAAFLALLTLDPQVAMANLRGWLSLAFPPVAPTPTERLDTVLIGVLLGMVGSIAGAVLTWFSYRQAFKADAEARAALEAARDVVRQAQQRRGDPPA